MPIRSLDPFISERQLLQEAPLAQLKGCRLGIEGTQWVRKIMKGVSRSNAVPSMSPLDGSMNSEMTAGGRVMDTILGTVVAMGGTPPLSTLETIIDRELAGFRQYDIQPFFVFNGMSINKRDKPFTAEDLRPGKRNKAWEDYSRGRRDQAISVLAASKTLNYQDYLYLIMSILAEKNVEFMRAPYFAWAQLAYLQSVSSSPDRPWINAIHSTTEILLFDVDSVITALDFDRGVFTFINKGAILNHMRVNPDQFLDICLVAGFDWVWTFPLLEPAPPELFNFANAAHFVMSRGDALSAMNQYHDHPTVAKRNHIDEFLRARSAVKHHLILTENATVEPLNKATAPLDIHEFIGPRLPDEIYFYLSQGMISPTILNGLASGYYLENHPLDNGETVEYRNFLESAEIAELRAQAFGLLTWGLHRSYQVKKIVTLHWYNPNAEYPVLHNYEPPLPARWINDVDKISGQKRATVVQVLPLTFSRTTAWVHAELNRQQAKEADTRFLVTSIAALEKGTIKQVTEKKIPTTAAEFQALVSARTIELRGLTDDSSSLTPLGKAYKRGLDAGKARPASLHEELLVCLELIRAGRLNSANYNPTYQPRPDIEGFSPVVASHIQLASRVMSLITVSLDPLKYWTGPLDRDLLVFQGFAKLVSRDLRCIAEMILMCVVMHELGPRREGPVLDEAFKCGLHKLPYSIEPSTALGIIGRAYLEGVARAEVVEHKSLDVAKQLAKKSVETTFSYCKDVEGDLKKGFYLWTQVAEMTRVLASEKQIAPEIAREIADADAWLSKRYLY
ncbi:hypothetical protein SmJEL517_g05584 [Synchytrium microbalum]|uniref:XPG N-terminal domain-containing protein n=1 Tax=Synchytrium microbalum TaxID=1806994 RepID=A0A507C082_9FUNG|nr:uncharacterized protein SmJEL517_g05584 [Synchytrium microbalum]TPX30943.1 hypothetical protein SmJEL517_g05584 [Synchytrium microbalum]